MFTKANILPLVLIFFSGILLLIYFFFNPALHAFPRCPTQKYFGFLCPGCGSQRAFHSLLHFNISEAFKANALAVLVLPYFFLGVIFETGKQKKSFSRYRKIWFNKKVYFLIAFGMIVFAIYRNV